MLRIGYCNIRKLLNVLESRLPEVEELPINRNYSLLGERIQPILI